ncbi:MAG: peptidoglycan-binding protein [Ktedonobacteraceae bacterium]|nr:peptidoglycan-binding protein [Ktedonobacteraceae bacterium]
MQQKKPRLLALSSLLMLAMILALGIGVFTSTTLAHAATYSWPDVGQGSTGENVYSIQLMLQAHGYSLSIDGDFGPQTASTVRSFQSAHGLSVDGIVGPQTWPVLIITTQQGNTGSAVKALQRQLNAHGANLVVDSDFGPLTVAAVKSYQSKQGLGVDGIAGPQTWSSLVGGKSPPPPTPTPAPTSTPPPGSTLWGVDTTASITSAFLSSIKSNYGTPDFVGRYLDQETGFTTGLTKSEVSYIHGQSIKILLIESDHGGDTSSEGTTKANQAIQQAKALGVPTGNTLFADVEVGSAVDSTFIQDWYKTITAAGYKAGIYENPLPGSSGFNSAFCASGSTVIANTVLYSTEPSRTATTKANKPIFAPTSPTCGGKTQAWQYALAGTAKVNADFDEVKSLTLW